MLNISRKKETASRMELQQIAQIIKKGPQLEMVRHIRDVYHLMSPQRTDDGRVLTHFEGGIKLPRLCFAAEYENRDQKRRMLKYNGLVVLEINGLQTYEQAMAIRNKAPDAALFSGWLGQECEDRLPRGTVSGSGWGTAQG